MGVFHGPEGGDYLAAQPFDHVPGDLRGNIVRRIERIVAVHQADTAARNTRHPTRAQRLTGRTLVRCSSRVWRVLFETGGAPELPDGVVFIEDRPPVFGARVRPPGQMMDLCAADEVAATGKPGSSRVCLLPDAAFEN